jgi:tRNA-specific 2-thiouridylase
VAEKPDSQEICFIPDRDYKTFVESRTKQLTGGGVIVDEQGHEVGRHGGVHRFTVGQRKGLGLSAPVAGHSGAPLYVLAVRPAEQVVVIGPKVSLERTELVASNVNWIRPCPDGPIQVSVQIRHRHRAAAATVQSIGGGRVDITFVEPQLAITPGQAAVFYDGDIVVGGGWIC